jgi:hypothetical protein
MVAQDSYHGGVTETGSVLVPGALTAERLTAVLREGGHLVRGRVDSLELEPSRPTIVSTITRLRATYSPDTLDPPPARLFLKSSRPDLGAELARAVAREVSFYQTVAPLMPDGIAIQCYSAAHDPATGAFHVLLEDLGETHVAVTEWPLPPSTEQCERIMDLYARFHAFWWDDPRPGGSWVRSGTRPASAPGAPTTSSAWRPSPTGWVTACLRPAGSSTSASWPRPTTCSRGTGPATS